MRVRTTGSFSFAFFAAAPSALKKAEGDTSTGGGEIATADEEEAEGEEAATEEGGEEAGE